MIQMKIEIKGLDKILSSFAKAPKMIYDELDKAIKTSAWLITTEIKLVTPVRTGNLRRGIRPDFEKLKATIRPHNADYAYYVHEGTRGHSGNPFMTNGVTASKEKVNEVFQKTFDDITAKL